MREPTTKRPHQSATGATSLRQVVWRLVGGALLAGPLVAATGCWDHCNHPDRVTYSCQPLPAGSAEPGCSGIRGDDSDRLYPVGCELVKPECVAAYPGQAAGCVCQSHGQGDGGTSQDWWCGL